jgi:hypothetical protein
VCVCVCECVCVCVTVPARFSVVPARFLRLANPLIVNMILLFAYY